MLIFVRRLEHLRSIDHVKLDKNKCGFVSERREVKWELLLRFSKSFCKSLRTTNEIQIQWCLGAAEISEINASKTQLV